MKEFFLVKEDKASGKDLWKKSLFAKVQRGGDRCVQ